jgi:hypothetical protein
MQNEVKQDPDRSSDGTDQNGNVPSYFGWSGAVLMGLAALARQLEHYPQGAKRLERLALLGLGYAVLVAWIKYGPS